MEQIHAFIDTKPYKIQTFRIGASGWIFFKNLIEGNNFKYNGHFDSEIPVPKCSCQGVTIFKNFKI